MRVLIADRNARLLESISSTFAHQFSIHTACTARQCGDLLQQGEFDLAIVCEKLADGPGLQLLGQIARSSPDTLRIFSARQSRLQLLKGKLGPFGLFRTLPYPIDALQLLSALTLARAGLEIGEPAPRNDRVAIEERPAAKVSAKSSQAASPARARHTGTSPPGPAAVRATGKRVAPASADPVSGINLPVTITSVRRIRLSELARTLQPPPDAQQAPSVPPSRVQSVHAPAPSGRTPQQRAAVSRARSGAHQQPGAARQVPSAPRQQPNAARQQPSAARQVPSTPRQVPSAPRQQPSTPRQQPSTPRQVPSTPRQQPSAARQVPSTPRQPPAVARQQQNAVSHPRNIAPQLAQANRPARQSALPQPAMAWSVAPPRLPSQSEAFQRALARREAAKGASLVTARRPTHNAQLAKAAPKRTTAFFGATIVVVFLVTTLTLHLFSAADARPSSAPVTRIARVEDFSAPHLKIERSDNSARPWNSPPAGLTRPANPARSPAPPAVPNPDSTDPDLAALDAQMTAGNTPTADPSTFGSEAFEPVYSN